MKTKRRLLINAGGLLAAICMTGLFLTAGCGDKDAMGLETPGSNGSTTKPSGDPGVAVVELFTSEGCSSCPPAEDNLKRITEAADKAHRKVFTLAFHVDYWNNLGWSDRFSSPEYSSRQSQYARALNLNSVYTPQMIVNGQTQFVGSSQEASDAAIKNALASTAAVQVDVKVKQNADGRYHVDCRLAGGDAGDAINLAVVESGLTSDVKRGENAGRTLNEPNAVRWFSTRAYPDQGNFELILPELAKVKLKNATVIAYAQRKSDSAILGAASQPLTGE